MMQNKVGHQYICILWKSVPYWNTMHKNAFFSHKANDVTFSTLSQSLPSMGHEMMLCYWFSFLHFAVQDVRILCFYIIICIVFIFMIKKGLFSVNIKFQGRNKEKFANTIGIWYCGNKQLCRNVLRNQIFSSHLLCSFLIYLVQGTF